MTPQPSVRSSGAPLSGARRLRRTVAAVLLGTTMLGAAGMSGAVLAANDSVAPTAPITAPSMAASLPGSFAPLVEKVAPAVVTITARHDAGKPAQTAEDDGDEGDGDNPFQNMFPPGSPFEDFFRRFQDQIGPRGHGPRPEAPRGGGTSLGSGFIIDPAGYVVTNNHVIDGANAVTVTLNDGTDLTAQVVGRDDKTDLALLKVSSSAPLPHLAFGDSDKAKVGDWVLAVGNPFGLGGTVTAGVISARGRNINAGPYDDFIQTDAAINRGNSGGPTFDTSGAVIGINTAIFSPTGGSVGIGFAIPSNLAKSVVAQLKEKGAVERGWLGVRIQAVTPELAEGLNIGKAHGALVAEVTADSPAAKAGVRQGDLITAYDGKPVNDLRDLTRHVADTKPGNSAALTVIRNGKEVTLSARIDKMAAAEKVAQADSAPSATPMAAALKGLSLAPLDRTTRGKLGLDESVNGVVVTAVSSKTAGETPVRPGDVIEQVGDVPVKSPADLIARVTEAEKAGQKAVLLLVNRQGTESFVALKLPRA
ncbi:serine protease Do [Azospirillum fermentarium]|uniref:DegQ family serine endoprotease n=1 Tax=Azospirillum fermentarium TaxID=1233114 RepID=UPI00222722FA|nr:DegQ family serine endoprotease [Azospirillum fermentarium]MCW2245901.1 serine protease Do [Azospirillum fermentarium]